MPEVGQDFCNSPKLKARLGQPDSLVFLIYICTDLFEHICGF